jgi:hypothetical protein
MKADCHAGESENGMSITRSRKTRLFVCQCYPSNGNCTVREPRLASSEDPGTGLAGEVFGGMSVVGR